MHHIFFLQISEVTGPRLPDNTTYDIHLTTDNIALFVWLESEIDGVFSDNGFPLTYPSTQVQFTARQKTSADKLLGAVQVITLCDTYDTVAKDVKTWRNAYIKKGNRENHIMS